MYIRMKKHKDDEWIKMQVSVLDFFCWNLMMGLMLGLGWAVLAGIAYAIYLI
jgi:hypothetical protein